MPERIAKPVQELMESLVPLERWYLLLSAMAALAFWTSGGGDVPFHVVFIPNWPGFMVSTVATMEAVRWAIVVGWMAATACAVPYITISQGLNVKKPPAVEEGRRPRLAQQPDLPFEHEAKKEPKTEEGG